MNNDIKKCEKKTKIKNSIKYLQLNSVMNDKFNCIQMISKKKFYSKLLDKIEYKTIQLLTMFK